MTGKAVCAYLQVEFISDMLVQVQVEVYVQLKESLTNDETLAAIKRQTNAY